MFGFGVDFFIEDVNLLIGIAYLLFLNLIVSFFYPLRVGNMIAHHLYLRALYWMALGSAQDHPNLTGSQSISLELGLLDPLGSQRKWPMYSNDIDDVMVLQMIYQQ